MDKSYSEVDEVLLYIHKHIDEPLPLSRMASEAAYSQYHFIRLFKEKTGLSPHYYVTSLRMQKAKDLLLHTNLSIRDIGMEIGQQSLGTFTTRFTKQVGMTPSQFRNSQLHVRKNIQTLEKFRHWRPLKPMESCLNQVKGTIHTEASFRGVIFVGLFKKPIPEGLPLYGTLLFSAGAFTFTDVLPGTYYLMATAISWDMGAKEILIPHSTLRARSLDPIIVRSQHSMPHQSLTLREPRLDDPPILISLPVLMNYFLARVCKESNF